MHHKLSSGSGFPNTRYSGIVYILEARKSFFCLLKMAQRRHEHPPPVDINLLLSCNPETRDTHFVEWIGRSKDYSVDLTLHLENLFDIDHHANAY